MRYAAPILAGAGAALAIALCLAGVLWAFHQTRNTCEDLKAAQVAAVVHWQATPQAKQQFLEQWVYPIDCG